MSKQLKPIAPKQPIILGTIGSAYGIHGWLKVFSSTETAESIFDYQPWIIQQVSQWQFVELEDWKHYSQHLIIKIKGINDRDAASFLTHCKIIVNSEQLPPLEGDDYYWKDLIDCQVITTTGYELGKVVDMMETASNDVMVVKANLKDLFGMKERLVPFLHGQVIKKVDLTARVIKADWDPSF